MPEGLQWSPDSAFVTHIFPIQFTLAQKDNSLVCPHPGPWHTSSLLVHVVTAPQVPWTFFSEFPINVVYTKEDLVFAFPQSHPSLENRVGWRVGALRGRRWEKDHPKTSMWSWDPAAWLRNTQASYLPARLAGTSPALPGSQEKARLEWNWSCPGEGVNGYLWS